MWLCMWKSIISEEILIRFLDYFNIFALCKQLWKIRILGPLLCQKWSPLGPLFAKNWVPFGSPFYNFWVPLRFGNSESGVNVMPCVCSFHLFRICSFRNVYFRWTVLENCSSTVSDIVTLLGMILLTWSGLVFGRRNCQGKGLLKWPILVETFDIHTC